MLKKRGECAGENFDTVGLLQTLCLVKMDTVDSKKAPDPEDKPPSGLASGSGPVANDDKPAKNNVSRPNNIKTETEMQGERWIIPVKFRT